MAQEAGGGDSPFFYKGDQVVPVRWPRIARLQLCPEGRNPSTNSWTRPQRCCEDQNHLVVDPSQRLDTLQHSGSEILPVQGEARSLCRHAGEEDELVFK